jgi:hypothetical protein
MLSATAQILLEYRDLIHFDRGFTGREVTGASLFTASVSVGNHRVRAILDGAEATRQRDQMIALGGRLVIASHVALDVAVVHGFWVYLDDDPTCLWAGLTGRL